MAERKTLLVEDVDFMVIDNEIIEEAVGESKVKKYHIRGPYMESETKNHNGRTYPRPIIEREVKKMMEGKIKQNRCLGELEHPNTTQVNLERASHLIKELRMDKHIALGDSVIMDTPMGKIAKAMIDEGVKLGVSSRGVGSLRESIVQNDFGLVTIDIVADPSAPSAFVDGILEGKREWVMENGILVEKEVEELEEKLEKYTIEEASTAALKVWQDFLAGLQRK